MTDRPAGQATAASMLGRNSPSGDEQSPEPRHWFEPIADHLGAAYLRYSFTKGTAQEVDFLMSALSLRPGERLLDVGCGPGRHAHELASRGLTVHGVDISERFIELATAAAPPGATFERLDARHMPFVAEYDAAVCLCQGAFGLMTVDGENEAVLRGIATALKPGGRVALSAFSSYFAVKYHHEATFDAAAGVSHERTEIRAEDGQATEVDLWTACYRENCGCCSSDVGSTSRRYTASNRARMPPLDHRLRLRNSW
jgi:SAM-dependent methyltransferase